MAKVPEKTNFVNLVEKKLGAQEIQDPIRDLLETSRALRKALPTEDSDNFPFYNRPEGE